jgi:hypothetical protein
MSAPIIVPPRAGRGKSHDPLVCGIDPEDTCSACRAVMQAHEPAPARPGLWHKLLMLSPLLGRLVGADRIRDKPPPHPNDELLVQFLALLADAERRGLIVAAIRDEVLPTSTPTAAHTAGEAGHRGNIA